MAAAGLKIVLPGTLTDSTLPLLRDDAVLSTGSLFLADLAHSVNPMAAGVPVDGAAVPNLAWKESSALLGIASPTSASASGTVQVRGGINNGVKGKVERTPKGGLHGIVSQSTALVSGDNMGVQWPQAVLTYMLANLSHAYYVSLWSSVTRAANGTRGTNISYKVDTSTGSNAASIGGLVSNGNSALIGGANVGSNSHLVGVDTVGQSYVSWAVTNAGASLSTAASKGAFWGVGGNLNAGALTNANTHWESWVFYRLYLEDLTVSGRTWAAVDAIDFTAYAAAFGTGGRYNGDTIPTAVTAVP